MVSSHQSNEYKVFSRVYRPSLGKFASLPVYVLVSGFWVFLLHLRCFWVLASLCVIFWCGFGYLWLCIIVWEICLNSQVGVWYPSGFGFDHTECLWFRIQDTGFLAHFCSSSDKGMIFRFIFLCYFVMMLSNYQDCLRENVMI